MKRKFPKIIPLGAIIVAPSIVALYVFQPPIITPLLTSIGIVFFSSIQGSLLGTWAQPRLRDPTKKYSTLLERYTEEDVQPFFAISLVGGTAVTSVVCFAIALRNSSNSEKTMNIACMYSVFAIGSFSLQFLAQTYFPLLVY